MKSERMKWEGKGEVHAELDQDGADDRGDGVRRKKSRRPYLYLDTNVILDIIRNRRVASTILLDKIKNGKFDACTSYFTLLEVTDQEQEYKFFWKMLEKGYSLDKILRTRFHRELTKQDLKEVTEKIDTIFWKPFKDVIGFYYLEKDGWDRAWGLMEDTSIRANDLIHLATALSQKCDLFVTSDNDLLNAIRKKIPACTPEKVEQKLKSLGFKISS